MANPTRDQIVSTAKVDVVQMENCKMWPFSCYAMAKEMKGCISGFVDISPEELRINYYINKANPAVHTESVNKMAQKMNENRHRLKSGINPDQIYTEYRNGNNNPSANFDLTWLTTPGKIFGGNVQPAQPSPFGSSVSATPTQSAFGGNPFAGSVPANPFGSSSTPFASSTPQAATNSAFGQSAFGGNPFAAAAPAPAQNSFATPTSTPFGGSAFGTPSTINAFGAISNSSFLQQNTGSAFGQPPVNSQPVDANPFQLAGASSTSAFGKSIPVNPENIGYSQDDSIVYSNIAQLTQAEIAAFQSTSFTIENIPINPPPKEACLV